MWPSGSTPWKPVTTTTLPAARSARTRSSSMLSDARLGVGDVGRDRHLPAGVADRGEPSACSASDKQADRDLLAGRGDHVELAQHSGVVCLGRQLLGQGQQAIGLAAHRRRHDDHLVARRAPIWRRAWRRSGCAPASPSRCRRTCERSMPWEWKVRLDARPQRTALPRKGQRF